ncbi:LamG domain-containing protein [Lacipirellula sp.]|uniref:LamG domain-containing protein n=1 Tax=Lacipirellula sp. TaxID=2691419 RepID=UPI003D0B05DF
MSIDFPNDELEPLLDQLAIADLDATEWERLRTLITDNSAAQRRYLEAIHLREGLAYLLSHEPLASGDASAPSPAELSAGPGLAAASRRDESAETASSASRVRRLTARWFPSWAAAAGIAFVAGAAAVALFQQGWTPLLAKKEQEAPRAVAPVTASPAPLLQETQLGKISGLSLDASAEAISSSMQVGQVLRCGEVVQLPVGFMRIQLDDGPELLIEGPAEFSLVGNESVFVRSGRLSARGGQRLLLQTPLLTAECLDASVAFEASDDDSASIYVSEGVVTLMTTPQERVEGEKIRVLHSGEGIVAEPSSAKGALRTTDRGPLPRIVTEWSDIEKQLSKYQQLILGDRPVAYWPLYRVRKNRRVLDLTQNGHDGLPIGNWPAELKEKDDTGDAERGVYFNGESYIEPDRKPPVNLQNGFAIEGWARPEGPAQYQAIFTSRWVLESYTPNQQCFGITLYAGDNNQWEFWTGVGKRGQLWNVMESPKKIDREQWSHVVGVFTPTEVSEPGFMRGIGRLYVNGEEVLQHEQEVSLTDFDWPARIGAAEFVPRYLTSWLFKGRLSDIALYGYPLEPQRIKEHYQVGQPTVSTKTSALRPSSPWLLASLGRRSAP